MAFHRSFDGSEPAQPEPLGRRGGMHEERRSVRSTHLATGTLACPACDAPIAPAGRVLSVGDWLACSFCHHAAPLRAFLSLAAPARPARVEIHVRLISR